MADVTISLEHSNNHRRDSDQDHTYCSVDDTCSMRLTDRLTMFRSKSIGCDVDFIVGIEQKTIKAHRLVLGCGSEVFETMFYGKMVQQMQENNPATVVVPDVTPHAFTTLINFLYSDLNMDSIKLDLNNVMDILYAAKKYDIKTLISACVQYLMTYLTASDALCLLSQARFFDEALLIKHCLEVIDENTDEALKSPGLRSIDRDTLVAVLERSELYPTNELVIFRAALSWSEAECERRQMEVNPSNQRQVLGPVLSLIRFPLMTVHEFGEAATSSLLSYEEVAQVFLHLTVVPRLPVPYPTGLRCNGCSRHVVKRFATLSDKRCNNRESKFCFRVDRQILVSGFGIFGFAPRAGELLSSVDSSAALDWQTEVEIELFTVKMSNRSQNSEDLSATETVVIQGTMNDVKPVVASFRKPVPVLPDVSYTARMKFLDEAVIQTYSGAKGIEVATVPLPFDEKINFHFESSSRDSYCCYNDVPHCEGQLPEIHFFIQWPEGTH
ncbi:BTB/POZ domain containing protein [Brugia malayi]|uniref:BTB/POZ domain containing protein n=2 Tax=Brugia malayi TaxID=6279 RepID=A0A0K0JUX9_BRUMA|nr:BTB/POZ domain containing protein [Brugia malayi]CDP91148.1 Bm8155, isoform b [Brugia malayi]VIO89407.1 BTB/POZ domain containing protein [Brugia malayi]